MISPKSEATYDGSSPARPAVTTPAASGAPAESAAIRPAEPTTEAATAEEATPPPRPAPVVPATPPADTWAIQVASFRTTDRANRLATQLRSDTGEVVAERMLGVYGEVGYEILQWLAPDSGQTLEPFVRIEYVDTQNDLPKGFSADTRRKFQVYTLGLHYKPIPNVVLKADYRNRVARRGALGDEFNLGIGVVF